MTENIRRATQADADAIYEIAEGRRFVNSAEQDDAATEGFLVSSFDKTDFRRFIDAADHFWVVDVEEQIQAYLSVFSCLNMQDALNDHDRAALLRRFTGDFYLIKQICVNKHGAFTRGAASALYEKLVAVHGDTRLVAGISLNPRNTRSVSFHDRHGFKESFAVRSFSKDGLYRDFGYWSRPAGGR